MNYQLTVKLEIFFCAETILEFKDLFMSSSYKLKTSSFLVQASSVGSPSLISSSPSSSEVKF